MKLFVPGNPQLKDGQRYDFKAEVTAKGKNYYLENLSISQKHTYKIERSAPIESPIVGQERPAPCVIVFAAIAVIATLSVLVFTKSIPRKRQKR